MTEPPAAYFEPQDDLLRPRPEASSPWSADMLHGRLLAGLAARAVDDDDHDPALRLVRLTLDMFRPPPMTPLRVTTTVTRAGRRVRALDVSISAGDVDVATARALLLGTGPHPDPGAWQPEPWDAPGPEGLDSLVPIDGNAPGNWHIRPVNPGGFWSAERMQVWVKDAGRLVAGEALTPTVRAALAADLPNPMANSGPGGLPFINPDLTLYLARPPVSEWIGLEVDQHVGADGIAVGACTMYDTAGPIGTSTVCAMANRATLSG